MQESRAVCKGVNIARLNLPFLILKPQVYKSLWLEIWTITQRSQLFGMHAKSCIRAAR
jgi:hypothetical protein